MLHCERCLRRAAERSSIVSGLGHNTADGMLELLLTLRAHELAGWRRASRLLGSDSLQVLGRM